MFGKNRNDEYIDYALNWFQENQIDNIGCARAIANKFDISFIKANRIVAVAVERINTDSSFINNSIISKEDIICEFITENKNKFGTLVKSTAKLFKDRNDLLSLEGMEKKFKIYDIQWDGKDSIVHTSYISDGQTKGKSKRTGRILGAAVGTIIAPGIGTVIGAAHGTGNKTVKSSTKTQSFSSESYEEIPSSIMISIRYEDSGEETLFFKINEINAEKLISFCSSNNSNGLDRSLENIKKLKELLDIDAITQEEFDIKKKALLEKI